MSWSCATATADGGTALLVAVIPNAKRTEAVGLHDGALRLRLAAPALEGRANEALVEWLAGELGLAKRQLTLKQGAASRRKRLLLQCPLARVEAWLDRVLPARP
ncbi:MAG: DUF167 domain-containing protein [Pseudomonadota bacterium]